MLYLSSLLLLWTAFASVVKANSSSGDSVLVVIEPKQQDSYSIFFDGLKGLRHLRFGSSNIKICL
jgi:oligosaccharyltransferase complex subunit beta